MSWATEHTIRSFEPLSGRGRTGKHRRGAKRSRTHDGWHAPSGTGSVRRATSVFHGNAEAEGDTSAGRAGPHWWTYPCMTSNEIPHRFGLNNDGARQATVSMSCLDVVFGRPCFSSGFCSGVGWFDPRRRRGVLVVQSGQRLCFDTDAGW